MSLIAHYPFCDDFIDVVGGRTNHVGSTSSLFKIDKTRSKVGNGSLKITNTKFDTKIQLDDWSIDKNVSSMSAWFYLDKAEVEAKVSSLTYNVTDMFATSVLLGYANYFGVGFVFHADKGSTTRTIKFVYRHNDIDSFAIKIIEYDVPIIYDKWFHLAYSLESTKVSVFVNGGLVYSEDLVYNNKIIVNQRILTGYSQIGISTPLIYGYNGVGFVIPLNVTDYRFYNHPLTIQEVKELYYCKIIEYNCNAYIGNTIEDSSGFGRHTRMEKNNTLIFDSENKRYKVYNNNSIKIPNLTFSNKNSYTVILSLRIEHNNGMSLPTILLSNSNTNTPGRIWIEYNSNSIYTLLKLYFGPGKEYEINLGYIEKSKIFHTFIFTFSMNNGLTVNVYEYGDAVGRLTELIINDTSTFNWDNTKFFTLFNKELYSSSYGHFNGWLKHFKVYASALTLNEIEEALSVNKMVETAVNSPVKMGYYGDITVSDIKELGYSKNKTVLDYSVWEEGKLPTFPWTPNASATASPTENSIQKRLDPFGNDVEVWVCKKGGDPNIGGGFYYNNIEIDKRKKYRFSIWINLKNFKSGDITFGPYYSVSNNTVFSTIGNNIKKDPCFVHLPWKTRDLKSDWCLFVGYILPRKKDGYGYNFNVKHFDAIPESGVYFLDGSKITSDINILNFIVSNTVSPNTIYEKIQFRTYVLNTLTDDSEIALCYPRMDLCDGSEPSIEDLLSGVDCIAYKNLTRDSNKRINYANFTPQADSDFEKGTVNSSYHQDYVKNPSLLVNTTETSYNGSKSLKYTLRATASADYFGSFGIRTMYNNSDFKNKWVYYSVYVKAINKAIGMGFHVLLIDYNGLYTRYQPVKLTEEWQKISATKFISSDASSITAALLWNDRIYDNKPEGIITEGEDFVIYIDKQELYIVDEELAELGISYDDKLITNKISEVGLTSGLVIWLPLDGNCDDMIYKTDKSKNRQYEVNYKLGVNNKKCGMFGVSDFTAKKFSCVIMENTNFKNECKVMTASILAYKDSWNVNDIDSTDYGVLFTCKGSNGFAIKLNGKNGIFIELYCGNYISMSLSDYTLFNNGWNFITLQWDGYSILLYVNGVFIKKTTPLGVYTEIEYIDENNHYPKMVLGVEANSNYTPGIPPLGEIDPGDYAFNKVFKGALQDFRLYNRVLSAEEIAILYNSYNLNNKGTIQMNKDNIVYLTGSLKEV